MALTNTEGRLLFRIHADRLRYLLGWLSGKYDRP